MNKKVVKYCYNTLNKMVKYHLDNKLITIDSLLDINFDLKKLLTVSTMNRYRIHKYDRINNEEFFIQLRELLESKYLQSEIVKHWLLLFTNNSAIDFGEVLEAADRYNANALEIEIKINECINLNENRRKHIVDMVLIQARNETVHENDYQYFIVHIKDKNDKECSLIYDKEYINELERSKDDEMLISKDKLLNTLFDYYIINKPKEIL